MKKLTLLLLAGMSVSVVRHFMAEVHCPTEWNSTLKLNWDPYLTDIQKAITYNPLNAGYHFKLARYYQKGALLGDENLRADFNEKAIAAYRQALILNPASAIYWQELGRCYSMKDYDPEGFSEKWLPIADQCFDLAVHCAPMDAGILFTAASHWVWRSKENSPFVARDMAIEKFQNLFSRSLDIDPKNWQKAAEIIWEAYPELSVVKEIAPDNTETLSSLIIEWAKQKQSL